MKSNKYKSIIFWVLTHKQILLRNRKILESLKTQNIPQVDVGILDW